MVGSTTLDGRKEWLEKGEEEGVAVMEEGIGRKNWEEKKEERVES